MKPRHYRNHNANHKPEIVHSNFASSAAMPWT